MYVGRNSHAQTLTEHYDEGGVLNLSSPYSSPEFQDAIDELRATPVDNPEYQDVAQKAAEEGYKNGTTVPLYSEPVHFARTDEVSGNFQNREGFLNWTGVTLTTITNTHLTTPNIGLFEIPRRVSRPAEQFEAQLKNAQLAEDLGMHSYWAAQAHFSAIGLPSSL